MRLAFRQRILGALLLIFLVGTISAGAGEFAVAASGRYVTVNGKPFLWLGDTAWLLAQVPSRDDVEIYVATRAAQGFTVIQLTAVMAEERVWGTLRPTSREAVPFVNGDMAQPQVTPGQDPSDPAQYDYWDHLDYVLDRIHAHGLRAALVADFVGSGGEGYKYLTSEKAYGYGRFLGERYGGRPELIWVLGGDNTPDTTEKKRVWNLVAKGICEGVSGQEDYSRVLMTYHINSGASSGQIWHEAPWLDFNMAQTWSEYSQIYASVQKDYQRVPAKPCGLGEGAYEDGPQYPTKPIDRLVTRKQACWSYFAGGYHTYGNGNVWHFDSFKAESTQPWKEAVRSSGAESLRQITQFLAEVGWWEFVPDSALVINSPDRDDQRSVAMRTVDGKNVIAYLCGASAVPLRSDALDPASEWEANWVNPATGEKRRSRGPFPGKGGTALKLPSGWTDGLVALRSARR